MNLLKAILRRDGIVPLANLHTKVIVMGHLSSGYSLNYMDLNPEYYPHPNNRFWNVMSAILNVPLSECHIGLRNYLLLESGIGLWHIRCNGGQGQKTLHDVGGLSDLRVLKTLAPRLQRIVINGLSAKKNSDINDLLNKSGYEVMYLPSTGMAATSYTVGKLVDLYGQALMIEKKADLGALMSNTSSVDSI